MDIAADSTMALDAPQQVWDEYSNLVKQATTLFGATHYRDYHFLFSLSDHVAHFGLEHHEANDSRSEERTLIDPELRSLHAGLLPHEYVHSWNGKYRRPADLTTSDYEQTMQDDLLWVYEGLTEYLGDVLTARSGLWTPQEYRDELARSARHRGRCSAALLHPERVGFVAARRRLLRRGRTRLVMGGQHHSPADRRQNIDG